MKLKSKTSLFAAVTLIVILSVYFLDYRAEKSREKKQQARILSDDPEQVSYIQITKQDMKIAIQKSATGWSLLEPIQDSGNNNNIESFLTDLSRSKQVAVIKESEKPLSDEDLREFGLDRPSAIFNFKNNLGQSKIISVGSIKNFEGNSFLRIDSENKVVISEPIWFLKAQNDLIHYREVKLYRSSPAQVVKMKVRSLRDEFEFTMLNGKWISEKNGYTLDQNKVREVLKTISNTNIIEYVFEGEPSTALIREKNLDKDAVTLELQTDSSVWSVTFNVSQKDKALYALTERPTFLVKVDPTAWETFGNLSIDDLRDRSSALSFKTDDVQKIYVKRNESELNLISEGGNWKSAKAPPAPTNLSAEQIKKILERIHDFKISEFVDSPSEKAKFEGQNMLILKTVKERLILQLNWGPSFKSKKSGTEAEYYYARTQLSDSIFALEKSLIDTLNFEGVQAARKGEGEVNVNVKAEEAPGEKVE